MVEDICKRLLQHGEDLRESAARIRAAAERIKAAVKKVSENG